jgi:hypothetical protein
MPPVSWKRLPCRLTRHKYLLDSLKVMFRKKYFTINILYLPARIELD